MISRPGRQLLTEEPVPFSNFRKVFRTFGLRLLLYGTLPATSCLFGNLHWTLELFSHFLHVYAMLVLAGAALLALSKAWRQAAAGASLGLMLASFALAPPGTGFHGPGGANLKVMQVNVLSSNREHQAFVDLVSREEPDLISVQEVDGQWAKVLESMRGQYPHQWLVPRPDNFGIALLSKLEFKRVETTCQDPPSPPAILADIELGGHAIRLLSIHAMPPVGNGAAIRERQLAFLHDQSRACGGRMIVMGDLNCTPWSPVWRKMLSESGLTSVRSRGQILGTWPAGNPFRIPIDHILVKGGMSVQRAWVGPAINSDHLALVAKLHVE